MNVLESKMLMTCSILAVLMLMVSCKSNSQKPALPQDQDQAIVAKSSPVEAQDATASAASGVEKIEKTDEEWRALLSEEAYYILRKEGTERPFTSDLLKEKRTGMFVCQACGLELFESETKFDSGTGWPSFYQPAERAHVHEDTDYKLGYARTEVECGRCGGHLGHVFDDGPKPTGLRYCINGAALSFKEK